MADKMILGENISFSMDPDETGLNNNAVIEGPSGCGKTMSFIMPCLLEQTEPDFDKSISIDLPRALERTDSDSDQTMPVVILQKREEMGPDPVKLNWIKQSSRPVFMNHK